MVALGAGRQPMLACDARSHHVVERAPTSRASQTNLLAVWIYPLGGGASGHQSGTVRRLFLDPIKGVRHLVSFWGANLHNGTPSVEVKLRKTEIEADLLWKGYASFRDDAHHHEEQRARVSNLILVISAALIAMAASEAVDSFGRAMIGIMLIVLGLSGTVFAWKFYEYLTRAYERAHQFYAELDRRFPAVGFMAARENADTVLTPRFKKIGRLRVHRIWMILNVFVACVGLILLVLQRPDTTSVAPSAQGASTQAESHK